MGRRNRDRDPRGGGADLLPRVRRLRHGDRPERILPRRGWNGDWFDDRNRHHDGRTSHRCCDEPCPMVRPRGRLRVLRQLVRVLDRPVPWGRRRGPPLCVRLPRKTSLRSARGRCALVWRALRATLAGMVKIAWRVPNFAMMRGTAPAKAVTPQKTVVPETPVKFPSGQRTRNLKEGFCIAP